MRFFHPAFCRLFAGLPSKKLSEAKVPDIAIIPTVFVTRIGFLRTRQVRSNLRGALSGLHSHKISRITAWLRVVFRLFHPKQVVASEGEINRWCWMSPPENITLSLVC